MAPGKSKKINSSGNEQFFLKNHQTAGEKNGITI